MSLSKIADNASAPYTSPDSIAQRPQYSSDQGSSAGFLKAQLGMHMDVPPPMNHLFFDLARVFEHVV
jgi:hypothetical protein